MDPVQYIIYLVEQGKSYEDALSHARQRFGLTPAQSEQLIIDARAQAESLLVATEEFI